jgi:hypothetical protein
MKTNLISFLSYKVTVLGFPRPICSDIRDGENEFFLSDSIMKLYVVTFILLSSYLGTSPSTAERSGPDAWVVT